MTCLWCRNDNVLDRAYCPHCGENSRRLEEAYAPQEQPDEPVEPPVEDWRHGGAQVGKSLALSAIAVALLVGGARVAHAQWPITMWPRSVPPPSSSEPSSGPASQPTDAAALCVLRDGTVVDPKGQIFNRWFCTLERTGKLYRSPDASTTVTGYLSEDESWFACQVQGSTDPEGGGTTWLYTQGDDHYLDDGWGYFPAGVVNSTWTNGPVPDLPPCPP